MPMPTQPAAARPQTPTPAARDDPLAAGVVAFCARHALLPAGRPVLAMVSGGADSTCLLLVLRAIHDGPVGVVSIDHGLRPAAAAEVRAVCALAGRLGLARHPIALGLAPGTTPAGARAARLAAAEDIAARHGYEAIATGHTADDQAETVLMRLARGSGRTGALGMAPRRGRFVRPLLETDGRATRLWCAARGLAVAEDPTNHDRRYARSRIRHDVLPALEAEHPGASGRLAGFAELLADEAEVLDAALADAWRRCADGSGLDARRLAAEPAAMQRLLVRRLAERAGLAAGARERAAVERVRAIVARGAGTLELPGGTVQLLAGRLIALGDPGPAPEPVPLGVPGSARFGGQVLRAEARPALPPGPARASVRVAGPLVVRGPRPGDRIATEAGHQRVGRLLAAAGVPGRLRPRIPIVADPRGVVWVVGHRLAVDRLVPPGEPATFLSVEAG